MELFYSKNKGNDSASKSLGTESNGSLINGKLLPFSGPNFTYFDTSSYLNGRAFVNQNVKEILLESYQELAKDLPRRKFFIMECSFKNGGRLYPHRTHQNGLSVDFMMPLLQNGAPYYALDTIGKDHYFLEFNNQGQYSKDTSVSIDFNLIARQLLILDKVARLHGMMISKVIIKTELKDELYATEYGKLLRASKIYVVQSLTPVVNAFHDEHFHVDFLF